MSFLMLTIEVKFVSFQIKDKIKSERVRVSETFDYALEDITNLDDFNQIVDWKNSSFL